MSEVASDVARDSAAPRRPQKSEAAFRTISEVSGDLDVPQHVLRFWESRFPVIKPLKRGGGRRYYRPEDVQLLRRIRDLLYKDGYTIRGVQKLLREQARTGSPPADDAGESLPLASAAPPPVSVAPTMRVAPPAPTASVERPTAPTPSTPPLASASGDSRGVGITGARRAMLESLLGEVDALRAQLAEALEQTGKKGG